MSDDRKIMVVGLEGHHRLAMAAALAASRGMELVHFEREDQIRGAEIDQVYIDELRGPPVPLPERKQFRETVQSRYPNWPGGRKDRRAGRSRKKYPLFRP